MNESALEQLNKWGFTMLEVQELGIISIAYLNMMYGINVLSLSLGDLKKFYRDIIENPDKYKPFAIWLKKRFDGFITLELPMRIYVGGEKLFLSRGDKELEDSLLSLSNAMTEYIETGYTNPKRISVCLYYINLIMK